MGGSVLSGLKKGARSSLGGGALVSTVLPLSFSAATRANRFYTKMSFTAEERGALYSLDFRVFFRDSNGVPVSPLHDIPLYADEKNKIFNMVVEVPRWTNAKMEISLNDRLNPIKQDTKKGKLRFVHNCFPHHGYIWNYGALPQTWEDPGIVDESTGCKGDNDPIDVCEIGSRVAQRGDVIQVKVLGTLALIDDGETDWKVIVIDIRDPLADQLNDICDVEKVMPAFLKATHEWFKIYKMPDGKPQNTFAFDGQFRDREFALSVIEKTHHHWVQLVNGQSDAGEISLTGTAATNSKISAEEANGEIQKTAQPAPAHALPNGVDTWHYVHLLQ